MVFIQPSTNKSLCISNYSAAKPNTTATFGFRRRFPSQVTKVLAALTKWAIGIPDEEKEDKGNIVLLKYQRRDSLKPTCWTDKHAIVALLPSYLYALCYNNSHSDIASSRGKRTAKRSCVRLRVYLNLEAASGNKKRTGLAFAKLAELCFIVAAFSKTNALNLVLTMLPGKTKGTLSRNTPRTVLAFKRAKRY